MLAAPWHPPPAASSSCFEGSAASAARLPSCKAGASLCSTAPHTCPANAGCPGECASAPLLRFTLPPHPRPLLLALSTLQPPPPPPLLPPVGGPGRACRLAPSERGKAQPGAASTSSGVAAAGVLQVAAAGEPSHRVLMAPHGELMPTCCPPAAPSASSSRSAASMLLAGGSSGGTASRRSRCCAHVSPLGSVCGVSPAAGKRQGNPATCVCSRGHRHRSAIIQLCAGRLPAAPAPLFSSSQPSAAAAGTAVNVGGRVGPGSATGLL